MAHQELPQAESSWSCAVQVSVGLLLPLELAWATRLPPVCSSPLPSSCPRCWLSVRLSPPRCSQPCRNILGPGLPVVPSLHCPQPYGTRSRTHGCSKKQLRFLGAGKKLPKIMQENLSFPRGWGQPRR